MVGFGKHLEANLVPEWKYSYVDYKALKKVLNTVAMEPGFDAVQRAVALTAARSKMEHQRVPASDEEAGDPAALLDPEDVAASFLRLETDVDVDPDLYAERLSLRFPSKSRAGASRTLPRDVLAWVATLPEGVCGEQEREFFTLVNHEVVRVNAFFVEKEREFEAAVRAMEEQLRELRRDKAPRQKRVELQAAVEELYRGLLRLRNFATLNFTAVVKILKKHNKVCGWDTRPTYEAAMAPLPLCELDRVKALVDRVESQYTSSFFAKDRKSGMARLRGPQAGLPFRHIFWAGTLFGTLLPALLLALLLIGRDTDAIGAYPTFFAALPLYRGVTMVCAHAALFAFNLFLWDRSRVNFRFIFEFNTNHRSWFPVWTLVLLIYAPLAFSFLFLVIICSQAVADWSGLLGPAFFDPTVAAWLTLGGALYVGAVTLLPHPLQRASRVELRKALTAVFVSPFSNVSFRAFFLADQVTSQSRAMVDLSYTLCFLITGNVFDPEDQLCSEWNVSARGVIAFLPYWWRFAQCVRRYHDTGDAWPHLANAGKYASSILVTAVSMTDRGWLWGCCAAFSTCYSFTWDMYKDWGLWRIRNWKSSKFLLRKELMYEDPRIYRAAMLSNFCLRITWVMTISPDILGAGLHADVYTLLFGLLEVYRRCQWNMFRVENEQLHNCGAFRAVRDLPLPFKPPRRTPTRVFVRRQSLSTILRPLDGANSDDEEVHTSQVLPVELGARSGSGSDASGSGSDVADEPVGGLDDEEQQEALPEPEEDPESEEKESDSDSEVEMEEIRGSSST